MGHTGHGPRGTSNDPRFKGWGPTPCWGCGSTGDHPTLGGHYWPCGTMKCASIRGEECYDREIAFLRHYIGILGGNEEIEVKVGGENAKPTS